MPDAREHTAPSLTEPEASAAFPTGDTRADLMGHLLAPGRRPTDARDRIIIAFDEHYTANGNAMFSAVRNLVQQTGSAWQYRVFCRGRYRGPRLSSVFGRIRLVVRPVVPFGAEPGWRNWLRRKFARTRLLLSDDEWIVNCQWADRPLLRALCDVERVNAIVVFTVDPEFALWVARLAHVFAGTQIPHIIAVTPEDEAEPETVFDLSWLRVTVLRDSSLLASAARRTRIVPRVVSRSERRKVSRPIAFDHATALSFVDSASHPYQLTSASEPVRWMDWISPDRGRPARVRDVVLFVRPDWLSCGSGTTFASLADYFRANDTLLLDIGIWPHGEPFTAEERDGKIAEQQRQIRAALYISLRRSKSIVHFLCQTRHALWFWPTNIVNQVLLLNTLVAKPRLLHSIVRRANITHIYLNHYFTYLFAKDLIRGRKFFMDTHDIQSINFVQHGYTNVLTDHGEEFRRLLHHEKRILRRAERLCFVSLDEMAMAAEEIPPERLDFIIALPPVKPCAPRPAGTPRRLLIVASDNAANERNLSWFLNQVWPKVLAAYPPTKGSATAPARPRVIVCGGIADVFKGRTYPGVRFHGQVQDLERYYELSDIVLLPVVMGAGVAIKTIEAVLYERPVVATRHALRGLPAEVIDTVGHADEPDEFAESILQLLQSATAREQQVRRTRYAANLLRQEQFYERLTRALTAVRLPATRSAAAARRSGAEVPSAIPTQAAWRRPPVL